MSWIRHDRATSPESVPAPADAGASGARGADQLPAGRFSRAVATMDPGYFAAVMATGIESIGADLLGYQVLSQVLLGFTIAAFAVLVAAYGWRIGGLWSWFRRSLRDPTTAMAYFTVVAGTNVLATRLAMAGHPLITLVLAGCASLVWVVLTYGLPWSIVAAARRPVLGEINGTWLIWVVSTQSLAIVAAALTPNAPGRVLREHLPAVAVCLWGVGVMLYLILIVIIFLRLLLVEVTPAEMGPAYWIAMGATAISVRAAAGILAIHGPGAALVGALRPFLLGLSVVLWAFGTWWIPLLVAFGIWRYVIRRYPANYEPRLWSVVFPLGMYTVASYSLGHANRGLDFMSTIAHAWVFVGLVAWAAVVVLLVASAIRLDRNGRVAHARS